MAPSPAEALARSASQVALDLTCPKCQASVKVPLGKLGSLLECGECGSKFAVGRESETLAAKPKTVVCERCRESQSVYLRPQQRSLRCQKCENEIQLRSSADAPKAKGGSTSPFLAGGEAPRWFVLGLAGIALMVLGGGVWWLTTPGIDPGLKETASRFTLKVLQGDSEDALALVEPNQGADFRQWLRFDVSRALESAALTGDARLNIRLKERRDGLVWVEAELSGVGQKKVVLMQGWRSVLGGDWRFDAAKTVERTSAGPAAHNAVTRSGGPARD